MRRFVTDFDVNYAAKGIAMLESLLVHCREAQISVLCLDEAVAGILKDRFKSRAELVSQKTLESLEPRLAPLREQRQPWEFYATHKPVMLRHVLGRCAEGEALAFIDADTLFFSDPEPLFREFETASVGLSPHRHHKQTKFLEKYGKFNAGFGMWRNDPTGRACLEQWAGQCLDWCKMEAPGDGRFMNQGYLNDWPERYQSVRIFSHPGANLAPWNIRSHRIRLSAKGVRVDRQPLIFFHYSALVRSGGGWHTFCLKKALRQNAVLDGIYAPYLEKLEAISAQLMERYGVSGLTTVRDLKPGDGMLDLGAALAGRKNRGKGLIKSLLGFLGRGSALDS